MLSVRSGTLDVSLLWVSNAVFEVVAVSGDAHLGGEDFTHNLVNTLVAKVRQQQRPEQLTLEDLQALRSAAEELKIALSDAQEARVTVPLLGGGPVELSVSRAEFEEINDALFARYLSRLSYDLC